MELPEENPSRSGPSLGRAWTINYCHTPPGLEEMACSAGSMLDMLDVYMPHTFKAEHLLLQLLKFTYEWLVRNRPINFDPCSQKSNVFILTGGNVIFEGNPWF